MIEMMMCGGGMEVSDLAFDSTDVDVSTDFLGERFHRTNTTGTY